MKKFILLLIVYSILLCFATYRVVMQSQKIFCDGNVIYSECFGQVDVYDLMEEQNAD